MDFDKYCKMVQCKVSVYMGSDYEITLKQVTKNNGVVLTGIMAHTPGNNVCPTLYVDEYYNEELTPDEVDYISLKLANSLKRIEPRDYPDVSEFLDFESVKKKIVLKLINSESNKELLFNVPHRRFHNLAIVYLYYVEETSYGGRASVLIRNEHLEDWNTDESTLYEWAYNNTLEIFGCELMSIGEVIHDLCGLEIDESVNMYVMTNRQKLFGAASMLYENELEKAYARIGSDYYILPSSIHELVLVPEDDDMGSEELLQMVTGINLTEVGREEVLADSVYFYNHETGEVEWIC